MVDMNRCSVDGCHKGGRLKRGWCAMHYRRWLQHGDVSFTRRDSFSTPEEALIAKASVNAETGCLEWEGLPDGRYARVSTPDGRQFAHRYFWEKANGPAPAGVDIDHECRNRRCVNVDHLRPVTRVQNGQNRAPEGQGRSGVRGVSFHGDSGKWRAYCHAGGRQINLGLFPSIEEASAAAIEGRRVYMTHSSECKEV